MPSLLTSSDITSLTGALGDHFDTFKQTMVVHKEPIKNIIQTSDNVYPGFPQQVQETTTEYIPVSGSYYALKVSEKSSTKQGDIPNTTSTVYTNGIRVKVQEDAKNYIMNGKTEGITFQGCFFNVVSLPIPQNYLGLQYYYFDLSRTM